MQLSQELSPVQVVQRNYKLKATVCGWRNQRTEYGPARAAIIKGRNSEEPQRESPKVCIRKPPTLGRIAKTPRSPEKSSIGRLKETVLLVELLLMRTVELSARACLNLYTKRPPKF